MSGKIQIRLAVLAAVAAIAALFAGALTAQADTVRELTLEVTTPTDDPAVIAASTATDLKFTVTNSASSTQDLGAIELEITAEGVYDEGLATQDTVDGAFEFFLFDVGNPVANPSTKSWSVDSVNGHLVQLSADDSGSTLMPGQSVWIVINVTPPNNENDADTIYDADVTGRQATDFSDNSAPGNTFVEVEDGDAVGPFDIRNSDGSTTKEVEIRTDEVLVTGLAVDCSQTPTEPCTGTVTESQTTVTVSANCDAGILVIDTVEDVNGLTTIGAAAFYDAFGGCDILENGDEVPDDITPYIVTVDFTFDNSLIDSKGGLQFAADYPNATDGEVDSFDPSVYVGDGNALPDCKRGRVVNCVEFIKGGPGVTLAQIKMLLKDPFSRGF